MTFEELKNAMPGDDENAILDGLREFYQEDEAFLEAIKDDDLADAVHEWADGQVSVYTYDVYQWIYNNDGFTRDHEEEAIEEYGAKGIEGIGKVCWYLSESERAAEALNEARKILES